MSDIRNKRESTFCLKSQIVHCLWVFYSHSRCCSNIFFATWSLTRHAVIAVVVVALLLFQAWVLLKNNYMLQSCRAWDPRTVRLSDCPPAGASLGAVYLWLFLPFRLSPPGCRTRPPEWWHILPSAACQVQRVCMRVCAGVSCWQRTIIK